MLAADTSKHYGAGYVSGAFDMFHIGHLNLIRRAKERCDFLTVGLLSDELIAARKSKWPVIPLHERMAIIKALKYVDRVVITTPDLVPIYSAWEKYRFGVMFSGDDWYGDPAWEFEEKRLKAVGADIVFFPYTKEVSTTKLQELTLPPQKKTADKARKISASTFLFPFDKVEKDERVVLYGTGKVARQYYEQLSALEYCIVTAFVDTHCPAKAEIFGKPLFSPGCLAEGNWYDRVVVASTTYFDEIIGILRTIGVPEAKIV